MSSITEADVREAFEDVPQSDADEGAFEVLNVERNRSQYRVFLDPDGVSRERVTNTLTDAFGEDAVFGVGLDDEMWGDDDRHVTVASFRVR